MQGAGGRGEDAKAVPGRLAEVWSLQGFGEVPHGTLSLLLARALSLSRARSKYISFCFKGTNSSWIDRCGEAGEAGAAGPSFVALCMAILR